MATNPSVDWVNGRSAISYGKSTSFAISFAYERGRRGTSFAITLPAQLHTPHQTHAEIVQSENGWLRSKFRWKIQYLRFLSTVLLPTVDPQSGGLHHVQWSDDCRWSKPWKHRGANYNPGMSQGAEGHIYFISQDSLVAVVLRLHVKSIFNSIFIVVF